MLTRLNLAAALACLLLAACGTSDDPAISDADMLARERAAAFFEEGEFGRARAELLPLVQRDSPTLDDLIHAAAIELESSMGGVEEARRLVESARVLGPDDSRVHWALHRLAANAGDLDASLVHLRRVNEKVPGDIPTLIALGNVLYERDDYAGAEEAYRQVVAIGPDFGGSWYRTAIFRLYRMALEGSREEESRALEAEFLALGDRGITVPSNEDFDRGTFGSIAAPEHKGVEPRRPWTWGEPVLQEVDGVRGLAAITTAVAAADGAEKVEPRGTLSSAFHVESKPSELLLWGDDGLQIARWDNGAWLFSKITDEPVHAAAAFDLGAQGAEGGDGDLDLVVAFASELALFENLDGEWNRRGSPLLTYAGTPRDVMVVDFDHEGDLDILVVGSFGVRLLRNDAGHVAEGAFIDVTEEAGLPAARDSDWCAAEDIDGDSDVDLVLGSNDTYYAINERGGRFSVGTAARQALPWSHAPEAQGGIVMVDKEGDGLPDRVVLNGGTLSTQPVAPSSEEGAVTLGLEGVKDNRRGVGAVVEVVVGPHYNRFFWNGEPIRLATGDRESIDVVRVSWPNGVVQNLVDLPARGSFLLRQPKGLVGSCPFLYTWDGTTYTFVTDVLGITPLGLPMAPGMLVPPDHDEYVLVRGDQLAAKDGFFEIQITEELREVTYLDRVRLEVVDHPSSVEIHPNERFTFPPFPGPHIHSLRDPLTPVRATGSDGREWTQELRAQDNRFAAPFEPYVGQFSGLANPWFVELEFDPARIRDAKVLRLALSGWLYWTDASVNMAAARHPQIEFVPPLLSFPDDDGNWLEPGPPVGFPAGKAKTMVIDISQELNRADPRVRVATTLALYWDSIRLAVDDDDAPLLVTSIEPASAKLWMRGFSRSFGLVGHEKLERYDWDELEEMPRWNQHPGLYTKLGECRSLVAAVDDRFAILGAGDALTVRFPADAVPSLPEGWTRDYLVFFDGWAKDRDPNTVEAMHVTPLPFHAMSGYPPSADERFPDDAEHRAWRLEWNTRPDYRWIEPLAAGRGFRAGVPTDS